MKITHFFAMLLIAFAFACGDDDSGDDMTGGGGDDTPVTVTGITVTMTDSGGSATSFTYSDPDGAGGSSATIERIVLQENESYTMTVSYIDESTNPVTNRNAEINSNATNYLVCYTAVGVISTPTVTDSDGNGDPIGLTADINGSGAGNGLLQIALRHMADKSSGTPCDSGDNLLTVNFDVDVEMEAIPDPVFSVATITLTDDTGNTTSENASNGQTVGGFEFSTCAMHTISVQFTDNTTSPATDLNATINANPQDYIVVITPTGVDGIIVSANDLDGNNQAIGLSQTIDNASDIGSGTFNIIVKRGANKSNPLNTGTEFFNANVSFDSENYDEGITKLIVEATDQATGVVSSFTAEPGNVETIVAKNNSTYDFALRYFVGNTEVTDKLRCEQDHHYVIYENVGISLNMARSDLDSNSLPVGFEGFYQTFMVIDTGTLRFTLKNNVDKTQPFTSGSVEHTVTFVFDIID